MELEGINCYSETVGRFQSGDAHGESCAKGNSVLHSDLTAGREILLDIFDSDKEEKQNNSPIQHAWDNPAFLCTSD